MDGLHRLRSRLPHHNVKRVFWSPAASRVMFATAIKPDGRPRIGPGGTQRQESTGEREANPSQSYGRVGGVRPCRPRDRGIASRTGLHPSSPRTKPGGALERDRPAPPGGKCLGKVLGPDRTLDHSDAGESSARCKAWRSLGESGSVNSPRTSVRGGASLGRRTRKTGQASVRWQGWRLGNRRVVASAIVLVSVAAEASRDAG